MDPLWNDILWKDLAKLIQISLKKEGRDNTFEKD